MGWLVRIVMALSGAITGWFVARDAANFGVLQMAVLLLLMIFFLAVAAFWPALWGWLRGSRRRDRAKCP